MNIKLTHVTALLAGAMLAMTSMNLRAEDESAAEKPGKNDGFVGVVTKVDSAAKSMTVKNAKDDAEMVFTFTDDTNVVDEDGKEIELTTIAEGMRIRVHAGATEGEAARIKVTGKQPGDKKEKDKDAE